MNSCIILEERDIGGGLNIGTNPRYYSMDSIHFRRKPWIFQMLQHIRCKYYASINLIIWKVKSNSIDMFCINDNSTQFILNLKIPNAKNWYRHSNDCIDKNIEKKSLQTLPPTPAINCNLVTPAPPTRLCPSKYDPIWRPSSKQELCAKPNIKQGKLTGVPRRVSRNKRPSTIQNVRVERTPLLCRTKYLSKICEPPSRITPSMYSKIQNWVPHQLLTWTNINP